MVVTLETRIDAVCEALKIGLSTLSLKCPNDRNTTKVTYATPAVYPVYLPQGGALTGEQYRNAPAVTVMPGTVTEKNGEGSVQFTLALVTWDPGVRENGVLVDLNNDGWRSLANLLEHTRSTLREAGDIGGMRLLDEMRAGLYDSKTTDLRPYYVGWMEVRFTYHYESVPADVSKLLI